MSNPHSDVAHHVTVRMANVILRTLQEKDIVELIDLTSTEPPFTLEEIMAHGDAAYEMATGGLRAAGMYFSMDARRDDRMTSTVHFWPDEPSDGPALTDNIAAPQSPAFAAQATAALSEPEVYPLIVKTIDGAVWDFDADRIKGLNTRGDYTEVLCRHVADAGIKWLMGRITPHIRQSRQPNSRRWSRVMLAVDHIVWVEAREIEPVVLPTARDVLAAILSTPRTSDMDAIVTATKEGEA